MVTSGRTYLRSAKWGTERVSSCRITMPTSDIQNKVRCCSASNRSLESYLADATVLHRQSNSPRYSQGLDFFHDDVDAAINKILALAGRYGGPGETLAPGHGGGPAADCRTRATGDRLPLLGRQRHPHHPGPFAQRFPDLKPSLGHDPRGLAGRLSLRTSAVLPP